MSMYRISSRNNALIFNISSFSGGKRNLVGALGRSKVVLNSIQKRWGKRQITYGKTGIFTKNWFLSFDKIYFGFWCNSKINYHRYIQFSLNFYINICYTS